MRHVEYHLANILIQSTKVSIFAFSDVAKLSVFDIIYIERNPNKRTNLSAKEYFVFFS